MSKLLSDLIADSETPAMLRDMFSTPEAIKRAIDEAEERDFQEMNNPRPWIMSPAQYEAYRQWLIEQEGVA